MDDAGHAAAADALAQLAPSKDAFDVLRVGGDDYGVLSSLVAALGSEVPKRSEASLYALASVSAPGTPPAALARRLAELRCGAALALSKGAYDSEVLDRCDARSSEPSERARLAALLRRPLYADRRAAWHAFTRSDHVKVREAALEAIALHPELGDAGRAAIVEALNAKKGGIVETAAEAIHAHPERVMLLSDREKRAAADPAAPPPTPGSVPARTIDPAVGQALSAALDRPWPEDLVETRAALLDAAVAVSLSAPYEDARAAANAACHDRHATSAPRGRSASSAIRPPVHLLSTQALPRRSSTTRSRTTRASSSRPTLATSRSSSSPRSLRSQPRASWPSRRPASTTASSSIASCRASSRSSETPTGTATGAPARC
jgi:hypothetical protein